MTRLDQILFTLEAESFDGFRAIKGDGRRFEVHFGARVPLAGASTSWATRRLSRRRTKTIRVSLPSPAEPAAAIHAHVAACAHEIAGIGGHLMGCALG